MSKILVGLTGSIACFKVAGLISDLVKEGHEVRTMATESALKFIGKSTLEGLSGHPVLTDLFADGENMEHIHAGRWADLMLIAPCTAHTMAKLKVGLSDDLITTTALAFEKHKPVYIAPAMNKEMWSHPNTTESYNELRAKSFRVIEPGSGSLACGEIGSGRMAEPAEILSVIFSQGHKRVLITGGGTREPIDGVRYIGNSSTGRTSQLIAKSLDSKGFQVDLLLAQDGFTDYKSLENKMKSMLQTNEYDAVIHAAAVSDYSVSRIQTSNYDGPADVGLKLATDESLVVELKSNPKILDQLRDWSLNKDIQVVGFKLTNTLDESERVKAIQKLFDSSPSDFVIHNDMNEIRHGSHRFRILKNDKMLKEVDGAAELANELSKLIGGAP